MSARKKVLAFGVAIRERKDGADRTKGWDESWCRHGGHREINAGLADSRIMARFANLGGVPLPMTPADFGKLIAAEAEKWAKVIRAANIKPE